MQKAENQIPLYIFSLYLSISLSLYLSIFLSIYLSICDYTDSCSPCRQFLKIKKLTWQLRKCSPTLLILRCKSASLNDPFDWFRKFDYSFTDKDGSQTRGSINYLQRLLPFLNKIWWRNTFSFFFCVFVFVFVFGWVQIDCV